MKWMHILETMWTISLQIWRNRCYDLIFGKANDEIESIFSFLIREIRSLVWRTSSPFNFSFRGTAYRSYRYCSPWRLKSRPDSTTEFSPKILWIELRFRIRTKSLLSKRSFSELLRNLSNLSHRANFLKDDRNLPLQYWEPPSLPPSQSAQSKWNSEFSLSSFVASFGLEIVWSHVPPEISFPIEPSI
jgi:hypothetical protein